MSAGSMSGVTYASGTIYNVGTLCPSNGNYQSGAQQGYVCDARNFGDKYLDPSVTGAFCQGYLGTSKQYGFGHGVTASQKCGECAQIRVPRTDGSYNYMTVMMVDHFTWSMEVGTTEIAYLMEGTNWVVNDRADFEFRIVGDYDCYASFDGDADDGGSSVPAVSEPTPRPTPNPTVISSDNGGSSSSSCALSSNWGAMTINPYWGSSTSQFFAFVYNAPSTITSFEIRGFGQSDSAFTSCVLQNVNFFQCTPASALTEPATVRLTGAGGTYYGENVIESMTGSAVRYGADTCSDASAFTVDDEDSGEEGEASNLAVIVAVALCCLVCLAGACWMWRWRMRSKRGRAYFKESVDAPVKEETEEQDTTEIVVEVEADDSTQMMNKDANTAEVNI